MAEKDTQLSITIRAVDRATAVIRAIHAKIAAVAKPTMGFLKGVGAAIGATLSRISSVIGGVLDKIPMIGTLAAGALGGAVAGMMHLINKFDDLGDKADRFGVSVDFLASMRYAAEKAGAPVEALDNGLLTFSVNMGKLSANSGRFKKFLDLVSPALEQQLKKAKSNEQAFYLLAAAMDKLKDPAKRAALAAASGLGPELAPLLAQGEQGVKKLGARFLELAGSQEDAAKKAGDVDDSMHDLHAAIQGAEAAIVSGLAPSMKIIVDQLRDWFVAHRADIAGWAATIGEKIPGAFKAIVDWVGRAIDKAAKFFSVLQDGLDHVASVLGKIEGMGEFIAEKVFGKNGKMKLEGIDEVLLGGGTIMEKAAATGKLNQWQDEGTLDKHVRTAQINKAYVDNHNNTVDKIMSAQGDSKAVTNDAYWAAIQASWATKATHGEGFMGASGAGQSFLSKTNSHDYVREAVDIMTKATNKMDEDKMTKIIVDFVGMPKGARASIDPSSTADVDLNVGHQMAVTQ